MLTQATLRDNMLLSQEELVEAVILNVANGALEREGNKLGELVTDRILDYVYSIGEEN